MSGFRVRNVVCGEQAVLVDIKKSSKVLEYLNGISSLGSVPIVGVFQDMFRECCSYVASCDAESFLARHYLFDAKATMRSPHILSGV